MLIYIRGAGDIASGVALRLHRSGFRLLMSEIAAPLAVRRAVSFSEAVYTGRATVEGAEAILIAEIGALSCALDREQIAVVVDPDGDWIENLRPEVIIDARMRKQPPEIDLTAAPLVIGLGPGFTAGEHCHAVVETKRGHRLGSVLWRGQALADTGEPDAVQGHTHARVVRAPVAGAFAARVDIGDLVEKGQALGEIEDTAIIAPIAGVVRGLLRSGSRVESGLKIGDIDPRADKRACYLVSDKALAVSGGVLEAILSRQDLRDRLWQ